MVTVIAESSNSHYTDAKVEVKERIVIAPEPYEIKHAEHEPLQITHKRTCNRRVVEVEPYSKKLREIAD